MKLSRMAGAAMGLALTLGFSLPAAGESGAIDAVTAARRAGNASDAAVLATRMLINPNLAPSDRARLLVERGLAYEMQGERDSALLDLTQAINARALQPLETARAFYDRGVTLDELGRTEDAIGDYSAALTIDPKFAAALNNRGNALRRLGRLVQARADYLASIAAGNAQAAYPNYGLGQIAEVTGRIEEARGYYRAALAADPQFALATARLNTLGDPSASVEPSEGEIHLRPPGQAVNGDGAPDDGVVHLHPPIQSIVHLHPPVKHGSGRQSFAAVLKPAISEGGGARGTVQLGAWRSQGDAANAWSRIGAASGGLLVGMEPRVMAVDLPGKGRYFRLRAGPIPQGNGAAFCAALHLRHLACIAVQD